MLQRRDERNLHLVASAPTPLLRQVLGTGMPFSVTVRVNGTVAGILSLDDQIRLDATLPLPPTSAAALKVELESAFVWHARQIYPDNPDPRELSLSVETIELLP